MNKIFALIARIIFIALLTHSSIVVAEHFALVEDQLPEDSGFHKPGALAKADTSLARVISEFNTHVDQGRGTVFQPNSKFLRVSLGRIVIDARATSDGNALLNDLTKLGLTNESQYGKLVSGLLPLAAIEQALALPSLRSITASPRPITHAGSITSQGDTALRADIARSFHSVDGAGVTVGVISDSYDMQGGAGNDVLSGDLPSGGVPVLNGESTLCGVLVFCIDEGRAMLQIIHDIAPGADLLFQTGIDGLAAYANAISNLAASGADVIVDDLLILNEPMFQDGIVAQAVDAVVASGVAYFTAAGNSGRQSVELSFDDSGEIFCIEFFLPIGDCDPTFERVGRMHDFDPGPGVDNYMHISIPENAVMTIAMQWDQPFGGAGPTTDYDIVLLDETGQTYHTISANDNIVMGEGWEALQWDNSEFLGAGTEFSIIITYDDVDSIDPPASFLKLVVFGKDIIINEYSTNSSTLYGHANAASAEAVGAAFFMDTPANGTTPPVLQPYSSAGGTPILFDINGLPLASPEVRQSPGIVATDGVNTTFFFDDSYGSDGIDDFFGTSAAAPHAAGIAALVLAAKSTALPDQVNRVLQNTAIDMGTAGVDYDSGYGLIQADAAIDAVLASYPKDMDGNGQADILLRDSVSGANWLYLMDGAWIRSSQGVNTVSTAWQIVGNGDYNGDSESDALWHNSSTGAIWMYMMNGASITSSVGVNTVGTAWQIVGNGDYDGDGNSDILLRHGSTGANWMYFMNGATINSSQGVNIVSTDWDVVGSGDYDGDGNSDILWHNSSTGVIWMYLMNGASIGASTGINIIGQFSNVVGNGDYNGDGNSDILLRNGSTGVNWMYLMNGTSISSDIGVNTVDTSWQITGDGDYDGDGKSDILLRDSLTGTNWMYLMSGAAIANSLNVNVVPSSNWKIVNVD